MSDFIREKLDKLTTLLSTNIPTPTISGTQEGVHSQICVGPNPENVSFFDGLFLAVAIHSENQVVMAGLSRADAHKLMMLLAEEIYDVRHWPTPKDTVQ